MFTLLSFVVLVLKLMYKDSKKYAYSSSVVLNLSWFVAAFLRFSTLVAPCSSLKIRGFVLRFAISR